ncbi:MAG: tRNA (adenosine(37)-N6)-dimethylallyltransferase MiaA [Planctomycetota bacterium]
MLQRFPIIVGPTGGGKSALAMALAERVGALAEIVSADSMQVFRGMDIGTAKPSAEERARVPHHLIDVEEPRESYNVERWLRVAEPIIDDIRARGGLPIVVGGTHLYAKALLEGMFDGPGADEGLRAELAALPRSERRAELERVDPHAATRIHPNDDRRTIRALEVFRLTGKAISQWQTEWDSGRARTDRLLVGLDWGHGQVNGRINARVKQMVRDGLVEEVRGLWTRGVLGPQAREAIGYKQLVAHLEGHCTLDEAIERVKIETRRFAKNQRTWLRRLRSTPASVWLAMPETSTDDAVERVLGACRGEKT